jgi:linoleoyl-CoA desaturase
MITQSSAEEKYQRESPLNKVTFTGKSNYGFSAKLKERVEDYFKSNHKSRHANFHMYLKTAFYVLGWIGFYCAVISQQFSEPMMLLMMAAIGFFMAGIGFNVGHDAIHGSYSTSSRLNKIMSSGFELVGASAYTWRIRHNMLHHSYTNIKGADGDLESISLMRFCIRPGRKKYHAYQHFYAPLLYSLTSLVWVFSKDYRHMAEERRLQRLKRKPPLSVYVALFSFKFLHYFLFLILPIFILKIAFWKVLVGFLAMHLVAGFMLAIVFQLGHCVEGPSYYTYPDDGTIKTPWAEHQLCTSANFGEHPLTTWICGGLNFQIEHHLYPNVCHVHYKAISKIVKATAKEFKLPYYDHGNFIKGVASHLRTLKYFGRTDPLPVEHKMTA